jgi:hypothetical protein
MSSASPTRVVRPSFTSTLAPTDRSAAFAQGQRLRPSDPERPRRSSLRDPQTSEAARALEEMGLSASATEPSWACRGRVRRSLVDRLSKRKDGMCSADRIRARAGFRDPPGSCRSSGVRHSGRCTDRSCLRRCLLRSAGMGYPLRSAQEMRQESRRRSRWLLASSYAYLLPLPVGCRSGTTDWLPRWDFPLLCVLPGRGVAGRIQVFEGLPVALALLSAGRVPSRIGTRDLRHRGTGGNRRRDCEGRSEGRELLRIHPSLLFLPHLAGLRGSP